MNKNSVRVAVVGARGYSGLELCRILLRHPAATLSGVFAHESNFSLSQYLFEDAASQVPTWPMDELESRLEDIDCLFLATPAEASLEIAPKAIARNVHVIDLSGAFRLKSDKGANYPKWYGFAHSQAALLENAVYGLAPFARLDFDGTKLVSNPGCYATSISMALAPLLRANAILTDSVVVDAKSGTTGAGKKASESQLFAEVDGECLPYKVGKHQHYPEIVETLSNLTGETIAPFFTTHLLSVRRGIVSSIYAKLSPEFAALDSKNAEQKIEMCFRETYGTYPLIRFGALGTAKTDSLLSLKKVVGSPRIHVSFKVEGEKLFVFSLIDNLLKGAASQAVENFNALNNRPIELGLTQMEGSI